MRYQSSLPDIQNLIPPSSGNKSDGRSRDIYARLLKDRIVFVGTPIDPQVANVFIGQLLFLDYEDPSREIKLYINSTGGEVSAGLAMYDTMQMIQSNVATYCMGQAASMAAVLLCAGTPGKRYALPDSRVLISARLEPGEPIPAAERAEAEQSRENVAARLVEIMAQHTGQPLDKVKRDTIRDYYMGAEEAREYGLIDQIMHPQPGRHAGSPVKVAPAPAPRVPPVQRPVSRDMGIERAGENQWDRDQREYREWLFCKGSPDGKHAEGNFSPANSQFYCKYCGTLM